MIKAKGLIDFSLLESIIDGREQDFLSEGIIKGGRDIDRLVLDNFAGKSFHSRLEERVENFLAGINII